AGVPDHLARLLAATPSLRVSWFGATVVALGFSILAAYGKQDPLMFLIVAPILPLAGVAAAFGPHVDPAYEVGLSCPVRTSRLLRQYASPDVAAAMLADVRHTALGGTIVDVTVLFADLRGFTSYSELGSPDQVVAMLNQYFSDVVPLILEQGGVVDKFVGDAMMAIWGAPNRQLDHALRGARAALAMQAVVNRVAEKNPEF